MGVVQNSQGTPLSGVRVYALWASTNKIISSAYSNASGVFNVGVDLTNDLSGTPHQVHIYYEVPAGSEYQSDYYIDGRALGSLTSPSSVSLTHSGFIVYVDNDRYLTTHTLLDVKAPVTSGWWEWVGIFRTAHPPTTWINRTLDIFPGASDGGVGVKESWYQFAAQSGTYGFEMKYSSLMHVGEGAWKVRYRTQDYDGNWSAYTADTNLNIDLTKPGTTLIRPSDYAGTFTMTPADNLSGVAKTEYTVNNGAVHTYASAVDLGADGTYTLRYASTDVAGNKESTKTVTFLVDRTHPVTTPSGVPAGWFGENAHITLSTVDSGSGVRSVLYSVGSGPAQPYVGPIVIDHDGRTAVSFSSVDVAGNVEPTTTVFVQIDRTPPVTGASGIPSAWTSQTVNVSLVATDSGGSGVHSTQYAINGGVPQTYSTPFAISGEGQVDLTFWSADNMGLTEAARRATVRIDKTGPVLSLAQGAASGGAIAVNASVSDALSGVASTRHRMDAGDWADGPSMSVPTGSHHVVEFEARDVAGNVSSAVQQVPLGSNPVVVTISSTPSDVNAGEPVTVHGFVFTNGVPTGSRIVQLQRQLSNKKWARVTGAEGVALETLTSALGDFSFVVAPTSITHYRVVCPASGSIGAATSSVFVTSVRAVLSLSSTSSARHGVKFTVRGTVSPKHRAKIRLLFDKLRSSGLFTRSKTIVIYSTTKGVFSKRLSLSAGTYHVSATHSCAAHAISSSSVLSLVVN